MRVVHELSDLVPRCAALRSFGLCVLSSARIGRNSTRWSASRRSHRVCSDYERRLARNGSASPSPLSLVRPICSPKRHAPAGNAPSRRCPTVRDRLPVFGFAAHVGDDIPLRDQGVDPWSTATRVGSLAPRLARSGPKPPTSSNCPTYLGCRAGLRGAQCRPVRTSSAYGPQPFGERV
jgi:hypothetical protein